MCDTDNYRRLQTVTDTPFNTSVRKSPLESVKVRFICSAGARQY